MSKKVVFIDFEVAEKTGKVNDFGAVTEGNEKLHTPLAKAFSEFVAGADYICGHNIVDHDMKYGGDLIPEKARAIDTLYLSPLLFPERPYHHLVKDYKLDSDEPNNPAHDAELARTLFYDEVNAYHGLSDSQKRIYFKLLGGNPHFQGFFEYVGARLPLFYNLETDIRKTFDGRICKNADLSQWISGSPDALAYALALISTKDDSVTPRWVLYQIPTVIDVMKSLRTVSCNSCEYCKANLSIHAQLKRMFGYTSFRTYAGEPLQERAVQAAVDGKSILVIFPTGGGKSITFQIPALMAGEQERGLTVVISPLQSLMKDQVDNLEKATIVQAVSINGMCSTVERKEALERVESGLATLLYISPEALRSVTIEKLLLSRNVVRFVIDEAHCFSAWGQDFRVDYQYIGDFIRKYCEKRNLDRMIPISCFTATAKPKVISDIREYFLQKLGLDLELFATSADRANLHYHVMHMEDPDEKYRTLRELIRRKMCPTIVYCSRTKLAEELADRLCQDGFSARPYHGQMEQAVKVEYQNGFKNNEIQIIVATSAFGMGVDKKDVGLVIHYEVSDSLENYIQEAGRAGRDQSLQAECYVLFNEDDLDKHFLLLNQTKLSISEIQQVWKAIKDMTRITPTVVASPFEISRKAGWDSGKMDMDTRVKTAIAALENAGYIQRENNYFSQYADSIAAPDMATASDVIEKDDRFAEGDKIHARRVFKMLISTKSRAKAGNDESESRVDYIADRLGLEKDYVIDLVYQLREARLLSDKRDTTAILKKSDNVNKALDILKEYSDLEVFLASNLSGEVQVIDYRRLCDEALRKGIESASVQRIKTIIFYWTIKHFVTKNLGSDEIPTYVFPVLDAKQIRKRIERRNQIAKYAAEQLFELARQEEPQSKDTTEVWYSMGKLVQEFKTRIDMFNDGTDCSLKEMEDALLYLTKIGAMNLQGDFMVRYSALRIRRLITDNKIRYKQDDYRQLDEFYKQKIQQIHIVGEYCKMMVRDYGEALQFVKDYFQMEYKPFISKYFKGNRSGEINRNITKEKYDKLFGDLSDAQRAIIEDDQSKYITVLAGPGSGKTRVLVHKLASLMQLEDVKSEQMLMLTFSRAAATEFKLRLTKMMGPAANWVEIKTFHSYSFDLLGKIGNLNESEDIVRQAATLIEEGGVEPGRITKTVLVIDEAQDMDENEFALVRALISQNEDMRVIAVGDDDQCIFEFRNSDPKYMRLLIEEYGAKQYDLLENYRSDAMIVRFANAFAKKIGGRLKTNSIRPVTYEEGLVRMVRHDNQPEGFEAAIADEVARQDLTQTIGVLTTTNEEALCILGLLQERNIPAKLIQTIDHFHLSDLAEIRYFQKQIDSDSETKVVSRESWESGLDNLETAYGRSQALPLARKILETFAMTNETLYNGDLEEFLDESKPEDFINPEKGTVLVSTIHKAKGREFDCVYLMLSGGKSFYEDKEKRVLYVGFTRARHELHVHYVNHFLDYFDRTGAKYERDERRWPKPQTVTLHLGFMDVNLGVFKNAKLKEGILHNLVAGDPLEYGDDGFRAPEERIPRVVASLSKKGQGLVQNVIRLGYRVKKASVRYVMAWKPADEKGIYAAVLPVLQFEKVESQSEEY